MSALTSTTVDWSRWMSLTPQEQRALWSKYRQIITDEQQHARFNNYRRLDQAIRDPFSVIRRG